SYPLVPRSANCLLRRRLCRSLYRVVALSTLICYCTLICTEIKTFLCALRVKLLPLRRTIEYNRVPARRNHRLTFEVFYLEFVAKYDLLLLVVDILTAKRC